MTEVDEKQGQYAQAILQIISENTDDTTFALTVTNNSYGLLTRFVVCSEDDQIFQECYKHFSTHFSQIKKIFKDILNNDIIEFGDYLQTIEDGNLLGFQEIGKQLPPEYTSLIKAASLPSKSSSAATTSLPSITVQEIPLIHNLFYGYSLQCSNLLDLLISQLKSASIISYCKSLPEIWLLVLDLFQAPSMPILELDENFFRIIQNWCLLIRYCITGSLHIFQKLIPSMKEEIYRKIIDFSLEHINSLSILLSTLNIVQSEEYTDKLSSVIDSVNSTINKCLNQGSVDIFLPITKLEFPQIKAEIAYREKIITTAQKILSTFDIEQTFKFLKRILSLITPVTSSLHSLKNCSNYFIWEIYCEVFSLLKCDSSNWSIYHSIFLQSLPQSFCSCISPQLLWNNLYLPVYGENLDTLLKLVQQNLKAIKQQKD